MIKERAFVGGAVVAGFLASLCCIGPLLFVVLGVGAFGAAAYLESARPFLLGGSVLMLAFGFYWTYIRRTEQCEPGEACATKPINRMSRMGLWIASVAVLVFALMPYVAGPLAAKISHRNVGNEQLGKDTAAVATPRIKQVTFKVEGMTCASCETTIKLALERTPGVRRADVSYVRGAATVDYDYDKTTPDKLRDAINKTGYKVTEGK